MDGVVWHVALCHLGIGPEDSSAEANARLIAAAPELYDCLKDALPVLRSEYERQAAQHSEFSCEKVSTFRKAQSRYEAALAVIEKVEGVRQASPRRQTARLRG